MKKYVGTKMLEAKPMNRGDYNTYRGWTIPGNENPHDEGYLVKYQGGYESWSPKVIFEEAYKECEGLTFGIAVELLKKGCKLARDNWNGKGMWIALMPSIYLPPHNTEGNTLKVNDRTAKYIGANKPLDSQPYIAMWTAQGKWQPGWVASQADILAEDWTIVE